jgi:hypothetical protein
MHMRLPVFVLILSIMGAAAEMAAGALPRRMHGTNARLDFGNLWVDVQRQDR